MAEKPLVEANDFASRADAWYLRTVDDLFRKYVGMTGELTDIDQAKGFRSEASALAFAKAHGYPVKERPRQRWFPIRFFIWLFKPKSK